MVRGRMRFKVLAGTFASMLMLVGVFYTPAEAWTSTINRTYTYSPPGGGSSVTACQVDSMNGEIFGTAFAKIEGKNGHCLLMAVAVIYAGVGGLYYGQANATNYLNTWTQSQQAGSNVFGGKFAIQADDVAGFNVVWSTSVF